MFDTEITERKIVQRAMIVGVQSPEERDTVISEHLDELAELLNNLGIETTGRQVVRLRTVHPQYHVGSGKAEEIAGLFHEWGCDVLVFDTDLSPSQQRNWERLVKDTSSRACPSGILASAADAGVDAPVAPAWRSQGYAWRGGETDRGGPAHGTAPYNRIKERIGADTPSAVDDAQEPSAQ